MASLKELNLKEVFCIARKSDLVNDCLLCAHPDSLWPAAAGSGCRDCPAQSCRTSPAVAVCNISHSSVSSGLTAILPLTGPLPSWNHSGYSYQLRLSLRTQVAINFCPLPGCHSVSQTCAMIESNLKLCHRFQQFHIFTISIISQNVSHLFFGMFFEILKIDFTKMVALLKHGSVSTNEAGRRT